MREQLEEQTRIAENKIRQALECFHSATGLVPQAIDFEMVDTRNIEDYAKGTRAVLVGELTLRAST